MMKNELYNQNNYTWENDWIISDYESPWGILEKFKYTNLIKSNEIITTFGIKELRDRHGNYWYKNERDLIELRSFDDDRFKSILGVDIIKLNKRNKSKLIDIFSGGVNVYIRNIVYYCPICINFGYHSILHQISYLKFCPYHNCELIHECPKCYIEIPYYVNDSWCRRPFVCKCGYSLFKGDSDYSFTKRWLQAKNFKIKFNDLKKILNLDKAQKEFLRNTFFLNELLPSKYNLLPYLLSLLNNKDNIKNYKHYSIKYSSPNMNCYDLKTLKYKNDNFNIFLSDFHNALIKNFKLVVKVIIKRIYITLKAHKKCISKLIYGKYDSVCPYAYAYLMWRREIEEIKYFSKIKKSILSSLWCYIKPERFFNKIISQDEKLERNLFWIEKRLEILFNNNVNNLQIAFYIILIQHYGY